MGDSAVKTSRESDIEACHVDTATHSHVGNGNTLGNGHALGNDLLSVVIGVDGIGLSRTVIEIEVDHVEIDLTSPVY